MLIALCVTCVSNRIFNEHNMDGGNFKQFLARRKRKNELFNEEVEEQFYKKKNRNDDEDDINGVMMAVAGVASTCVQKERKDRGPKILRDKTWRTYGLITGMKTSSEKGYVFQDKRLNIYCR